MSSVLNDHTKLNSRVWSLWRPSMNLFEYENLRCNNEYGASRLFPDTAWQKSHP